MADLAQPFDLGDWRVEPSLNRLEGDDGSQVRIEPKMMDVLVFLAERPGQVVSKDEVADAVWTDLFITESVITRAISGLRRALGDDSRAPRYIETIAKRGYRLLMTPRPLTEDPAPTRQVPTKQVPPTYSKTLESGTSPAPHRAPHQVPPASADAPSRPLVSQWVCGERFVGREALVEEALHGERNGLWLLGTRAIGKTSILRQLEWLTTAPDSTWWPLFLDLQGIDHLEELDEAFAEGLLEAEPRLEGLIDEGSIASLADGGFLQGIGRLRQHLRRRERRLLLLVDEAEELVSLHRQHPGLLRKLRRKLLSAEGIRTVLAASPRFWQLSEQRDDTSPFLHGFAPPLAIGPLTPRAARNLLGTFGFDSATADRLGEAVGRHPTLLQLAASRVQQGEDLATAAEAIALDPTVRFFFEVDFDLLTESERRCLESLAGNPEATGETCSATDRRSLELLGLIAREAPDAPPKLASPPFARWLQERQKL